MPGFRAHITASSIIGASYGAAAWYLGGMPPTTAALGAGVCAVSGMLPDLDSGPGAPLRESVAFAAAIVPMLMIHRFQQWGMPLEAMIIAAAAIYAALRFGLTWLLENYAKHRGMLHSVPAAAIAGTRSARATSARSAVASTANSKAATSSATSADRARAASSASAYSATARPTGG